MRTAFLIACIILLSVVGTASQTTPPKCPVISVVGPQGISLPGDVMVLRAQISGLESGSTVTYEWKVSGGQILEGQTTDHLRVRATEEDAGSFIKATVLVKGLPEKCANSASDAWGVMQRTFDTVIDQYGRIPWRDEQGRLDNFHIQIVLDPGYTGFIYIKIKVADSVDAAKKHARKIAKYFRSRDKHFDLGRLRIGIYRGAGWHSISFFIFPKGSKVPLCSDSCILLNAKDL